MPGTPGDTRGGTQGRGTNEQTTKQPVRTLTSGAWLGNKKLKTKS